MKSYKITTAILLMLVPAFLLAQVNGNGKLMTITLEVENVQKLDINFPVNLVLDNSMGERLQMTADANVFKHIGRKQNGNRYNITQDQWIEPSQMVKITGSLPALQSLHMSGYGKAEVQKIKGDEFELNMGVGSANIGGAVNTFIVSTKTGKIDAQDLKAQKVNAKVSSFGKIKLNCEGNLMANATRGGKVLYVGKPQNIAKVEREDGKVVALADYKAQTLPPIVYISFKIKNNRKSRINAFVSGPEQRPFSYGFPLGAYQSRQEKWPIGTKIYLGHDRDEKRLLYTVQAGDENKTVDLF